MCVLQWGIFLFSNTSCISIASEVVCVCGYVCDRQFYLEELVKQEGEPVGEHLLSNRLRPGREMKGKRREKATGEGEREITE